MEGCNVCGKKFDLMDLTCLCDDCLARISSECNTVLAGDRPKIIEVDKAIEIINDSFSSTWLNPLLTDKNTVIGEMPVEYQGVEKLLTAIKKRLIEMITNF